MPDDLTRTDLRHPVLELETAAMHRWLSGDPDGYLEISAPEVRYTDPFLPGWLTGHRALAEHDAGLRGQVRADAFAFQDPVVHEARGSAVLTFGFTSWIAGAATRWHCTEAYRHHEGRWWIAVTPWAFAPDAG